MRPTTDHRSVWWGSDDTDPSETPTPVELPAKADVLVVGGGLTGLSTALLLARAGRSPVVVEARRVGSGTTGRSSAKVSLLQGALLQRLREHVNADTVRAYIEANRLGQTWLLEQLEATGTPFERRLALTYAVTPEGAEKVAREREAAHEAGLAVSDAPDHDLPFAVTDVIGLADQVQIDPLAAVRALARLVTEAGGTIVEGAHVSGISFGRPWTTTTSAGDITADVVVLATQVPIVDRGFHFARLSAHRSYMFAYPADLTRVPASLSLSLDEKARSLRTFSGPAGDFLLVGGNGHEAGTTESVATGMTELDGWARAAFDVGDPVRSWSAQDYRMATQLPSVGPLPGTNGTLLAATGFDKWGLANAAAAAHLLTGDITDEPAPFVAAWRAEGIGPSDITAIGTRVGTIAAHWFGDRLAAGGPDVPGSPLRPEAVAQTDGRTCRLSAVCTHLGGIVQWNDVEESWDCPLHGSRFTADGTLLEGPATRDLKRLDTS